MSEAVNIERAYREHGHLVLRRARKILGNEEDARELLQDVFASLLRRPEQFGGRSTLPTFLYRMTTNMCLNRLRNHRRRGELLSQRTKSMQTTTAPAGESHARAAEILSTLDEDQARLAIYYYVDEMTHKEIAGIVGCSRRHVSNLLERVRDRLAAEESHV